MSEIAGREGSLQRARSFSKSDFDEILLGLARHAKDRALGATLISNRFAKKGNVVANGN
jgi:hypothetical protein